MSYSHSHSPVHHENCSSEESLSLPPGLKTRKPDHPIHILLAEDNTSDIMLTEIALDAANMNYELHTLRTGAEVVPYLSKDQNNSDHPPATDVLMLDLNLPAKDGFEILAELASKADRYADLPIVILTGDTHCGFLTHSYDLNIAAYLTKPCSSEKMQDALGRIFG